MTKALINPSLLKWAREKSGFEIEEAAKKTKQKVERLVQWEKGEDLPTFKQLLNIAELYKRPISLFYLPEPPDDFMTLKDYRHLPDNLTPTNISSRLNFEIRKAYTRRQIAIELYEALEERLPKLNYRINLQDKPEEVGEKIRSLLNVSMQKQIEWKSEYEALSGWRKALEHIGVLVFQVERVDVSEMRGFAISESPLPVIAINKKDMVHGRIFSMLHEFAHILLGDSSLSGDDGIEPRSDSEKNKTEVFCNHVAAATLLPLSFFQKDSELALHDIKNDWNDINVFSMVKRFNISSEFMWRRLLTRGKISRKTYKEKREEILNKFKISNKDKKSFPVPYHRRIMSSIGNLYASLIISSYKQEKITSSTLSEYLEIKIKYLPKIEENLSRGNT